MKGSGEDEGLVISRVGLEASLLHNQRTNVSTCSSPPHTVCRRTAHILARTLLGMASSSAKELPTVGAWALGPSRRRTLFFSCKSSNAAIVRFLARNRRGCTSLCTMLNSPRENTSTEEGELSKMWQFLHGPKWIDSKESKKGVFLSSFGS